MKSSVLRVILPSIGLLFIGCKYNTTNNTSNTSSTKLSTCVSVYTLGDVKNAVVVDSANKIAVYDENSSKYCFSGEISYPIKVFPNKDTYIDVDYDNKKSANDIKPKFSMLESYFPFVDLVTTIHAKKVDENLSTPLELNQTRPLTSEVVLFYEKQLEDKYPISLNPNNKEERILNFVLYDKNLTSPIKFDEDYLNQYNLLSDFFNYKLNIPSIEDDVKYYSFYHSLELLDKKLIQRVDETHRPIITYLYNNNQPLDNNILNTAEGYVAKDIKGKDDAIYVASGFDGIYKFDKNLTMIKNIKVNDTFSNMYELDILDINNSSLDTNDTNETNETNSSNLVANSYVIGADGGYSLDFFNIDGFVYKDKIFWKYYREVNGTDVPITIDDTTAGSMKQVDDVISVKTYVSPYIDKMWLAFGSRLNGVYLVDLKKLYPKLESNISYPMIVLNTQNDVNNTLLIPKTEGTAISEEFSSDGENLYVSTGNVIQRYDLSSLANISNVANTFNVKANKAYRLLMVNNNHIDDELFVSTDKGVEVYDILNSGDLSFISKYDTEGAMVGYYPRMSFVSDKNILLFTDGYKGIKVIKYDESFNPELCGVGYFYPSNDKTKLAKVTSVYSYKDSNDGKCYVIVGVEGFGLVKVQLKDLLFKHCLENY